MIRALFYVNSVEKFLSSDLVKLSPLFCGRTHQTPEEEDACESHCFSKATPSGSLSMQIDNPRARGTFAPGQRYYLDFTPVPVP